MFPAIIWVWGCSCCIAQAQPVQGSQIGQWKNGMPLTEEALVQIFAEHRRWVASKHARGKRADLSQADLSAITLEPVLNKAHAIAGADDLQDLEFPEVKFSHSILSCSFFSHPDSTSVDLHKSDFGGAEIKYADLSGANLSSANFNGADLSGSYCYKTDFTNASMIGTVLRRVTFKETALSEAKVWGADFEGAFFDLKPKSLPYLPYLAAARNLDKLEFIYSEASLAELRGALRDAGLRHAERQINYALQRERTDRLGYHREVVDYWFRYVFFDLTCAYGMVPGRPLGIMAAASLVFALPYLIAICCGNRSGIWAV